VPHDKSAGSLTGICGVRTHIMNELAHDMHTWAAQYPAVQDYMATEGIACTAYLTIQDAQ